MDLVPVRLGPRGIAKQIFLGSREADDALDYQRAFIEMARQPAAAKATDTATATTPDV